MINCFPKKAHALTFLLCSMIAVHFTAQKPQFISTESYFKWCSWNPAFICTTLEKSTYVLNESRKNAILKIMNSLNECNKYGAGFSDARAHYIALRATAQGVRTFKIWLIAQSMYSVFGDGLSYKSQPDIKWQYAVANAAYDESGEIVVFDPVMNLFSAVKLEDWLNAFNASYGVYFFTCAGYYQFDTDKIRSKYHPKTVFNGVFRQMQTPSIKDSIAAPERTRNDWTFYLSQRMAAIEMAADAAGSANKLFMEMLKDFSKYKQWLIDTKDPSFLDLRKILNERTLKFQQSLRGIYPAQYREFFMTG